jgi:hypothetical protein
MPNLLPNWLPWIRPAGRLIWGCIALVIGLMYVVALMKRPLIKRPFPNAVGYAVFPIIVAVGLLAAKALPNYQTWCVWLAALALVGHGLLMVASSRESHPEEPATWAECFAGAIGVFALFIVGFAIIPSEWLNYANSYLNWGDTTKFVFTSHEQMLFLPFHWPFNYDYPSMRDTVAVLIYVVTVGLDLKLWSMWQRRHEVKEAPAVAEGAPAKRSRFGRPVRVRS